MRKFELAMYVIALIGCCWVAAYCVMNICHGRIGWVMLVWSVLAACILLVGIRDCVKRPTFGSNIKG